MDKKRNHRKRKKSNRQCNLKFSQSLEVFILLKANLIFLKIILQKCLIFLKSQLGLNRTRVGLKVDTPRCF